jgi:hypothetical protein
MTRTNFLKGENAHKEQWVRLQQTEMWTVKYKGAKSGS